MKKIFAVILTTVTVLSIGVTSAFAAGRGTEQRFAAAGCSGICAHIRSICRDICTDSSGICSNYDVYHECDITETKCCRYYIDENSDGICDNYTTGSHARGTGHCARRGHHR